VVLRNLSRLQKWILLKAAANRARRLAESEQQLPNPRRLALPEPEIMGLPKPRTDGVREFGFEPSSPQEWQRGDVTRR
jgi:hypothetical protein